jgi:hypothetical protein
MGQCMGEGHLNNFSLVMIDDCLTISRTTTQLTPHIKYILRVL